MSLFHFFISLLTLLLSLYFFNSCSGAFSQRNRTLGSSLYSPIKTAPDDKPTTTKQEKPPASDPTKFNYLPYDLKLDTIAFLTCEYNLNAQSIFTLKAGSYFAGSGLRLSDYFLKQSKKLNKQQLKDLIKSSTLYQAYPKLVVSLKTDIMQRWSKWSTNFNLQYPSKHVSQLIDNHLKRIQNPDGYVIESLIQAPKDFFYLPHTFNTSARGQQSAALNLVYEYQPQASQKSPAFKFDSEDFHYDDHFYGRRYQLKFKPLYNHLNSTNIQQNRYVLQNITEEKRPKGNANHQESANWSCPEQLKLMVRRHETDRPEEEESCEDSASGGDYRAIANQVLHSRHPNRWNINIDKRCISPKTNGIACYHLLQNQIDPETRAPISNIAGEAPFSQNQTPDCGVNHQDPEEIKNYCPHWLSICVRTN